MSAPEHEESRAIAERYARREVGDRYHPLRPEIWQARQERERALIALLRRNVRTPLAALEVLEIGCGHGDNLLELLRLGLDPARLAGNELLPARAAAALTNARSSPSIWRAPALTAASELATASPRSLWQCTEITG